MNHGQFSIFHDGSDLVITADQTYLITMGELAQEIVRACI